MSKSIAVGLAAAMTTLAADPSFAAAPPAAPSPAAIAAGNAAFQYHCAPCHGPGPGERARFLPGTEALTVKYRGERPGVLEQRTDLSPEYVGYVIRHGIEGMPFFRKTEISDGVMAEIGAYLAQAGK